MRRTTITLTDAQERALAGLAQPGPYQDELRSWARDRGIELSGSPAEAALVRVLIDAGIEHVRAHSADVAYRELAEVYVDEGLTGEVTALGGEALHGHAPHGHSPHGDAPSTDAPSGPAAGRDGAGRGGAGRDGAGREAAGPATPAAGIGGRKVAR